MFFFVPDVTHDTAKRTWLRDSPKKVKYHQHFSIILIHLQNIKIPDFLPKHQKQSMKKSSRFSKARLLFNNTGVPLIR
jgi:hypothetical protein